MSIDFHGHLLQLVRHYQLPETKGVCFGFATLSLLYALTGEAEWRLFRDKIYQLTLFNENEESLTAQEHEAVALFLRQIGRIQAPNDYLPLPGLPVRRMQLYGKVYYQQESLMGILPYLGLPGLQQRGGAVALCTLFIVWRNFDEVLSFLQGLALAHPTNGSIGLRVNPLGHTFACIYWPRRGRWVVVDVDRSEIFIETTDIHQAAFFLHYGTTLANCKANQIVNACSIDVLCCQTDVMVLSNCLRPWAQHWSKPLMEKPYHFTPSELEALWLLIGSYPPATGLLLAQWLCQHPLLRIPIDAPRPDIGTTILVMAVVCEATEWVRFLLRQGANPNQRVQKLPLLTLAKGNQEITALLMQHGAHEGNVTAPVQFSVQSARSAQKLLHKPMLKG